MDFTWFQFLLFVHIACVTIWLGGAAMIQFFALRVLGSDDPLRTATFASDVEWIGMRVFKSRPRARRRRPCRHASGGSSRSRAPT
jgi:hypothetical protein